MFLMTCSRETTRPKITNGSAKPSQPKLLLLLLLLVVVVLLILLQPYERHCERRKKQFLLVFSFFFLVSCFSLFIFPHVRALPEQVWQRQYSQKIVPFFNNFYGVFLGGTMGHLFFQFFRPLCAYFPSDVVQLYKKKPSALASLAQTLRVQSAKKFA